VLKTTPRNWFTWNCDVVEDNLAIGSIEFSAWGEAGQFFISNSCYVAYRETPVSAIFFLEQNGERIAWAVKSNPFARMFEINYADTKYELKAESPFSREFVLQERELIIGAISPEHLFTRRAIADLPTTIPLPLRLFMIWLVLLRRC
jgi:hypothetical protein